MSGKVQKNFCENLDEKIIAYYNEGYSQKDIHSLVKISLPYIRKVLLDNGYNTRKYRSVDLDTKNIIELLIYEGYSYRMISCILDISFHVIREIKESRDLNISQKERFSIHDPVHSSVYETFINEFKSGSSFLFLYETMNLGMQDVCPLASMIVKTENLILQHEKHLNNRIYSMLEEGYPVHMIAKKLYISVSVVKEQKGLVASKKIME